MRLSIFPCACWTSVYLLWRNLFSGQLLLIAKYFVGINTFPSKQYFLFSDCSQFTETQLFLLLLMKGGIHFKHRYTLVLHMHRGTTISCTCMLSLSHTHTLITGAVFLLSQRMASIATLTPFKKYALM